MRDVGFVVAGENCRSGCLTKDHNSWGECARSSNMRVAYCGIAGGDATAQKAWDREIKEFRSAQAQGIRPASTKTKDIRAAVDASNRMGKAFDAGKVTNV